MKTSEPLLVGYLKEQLDTIHQQTKQSKENQNEDISLCIETVSGKIVNPDNPNVDSIDFLDIAWALSRQPRFAGHSITEIPYNVAQHSVYVSELTEKILNGDIKIDDAAVSFAAQRISDVSNEFIIKTIIKSLFHDGHEAYTSDIPSPIKRIPTLYETLKVIEQKLDEAIYAHLNLEPMHDEEKIIIKYCDKIAQSIEAYQYMPSRGKNWNLPKPSITMLQKFPAPLPPLESYQLFISRFSYLNKKINNNNK